jgi:uncharacterized protein YkwD
MAGLSPEGFFDLSAGNDTYTVPANLLATAPQGLRALEGADSVQGSEGGDFIYGNTGNDRLRGNGGNDSLLGGRDQDDLDGGLGDDLVAGNLGNDWVVGGDGNDTLVGGRDADLLLGGAGNDFLSGDLGSDVLIGSAGTDTFSLRGDATGLSNVDVVLDFDPTVDRLQLNNLSASDMRFQTTSYSLSLLVTLLQGSSGSLPPGLTLPANATAATIRQTIQSTVGVDIDPDGDGSITGTLVTNAAGQEIAFFLGAAPDAVARAAGGSTTNGGGTSGGGTSAFTSDILTTHNSYRSAVGVAPLTWSDSLARDAQAWANQLASTGAFNHAQNTGQGENLARGTSGAYSAKALVDLWGAEKRFFKQGIFPNVSTTGNWADVGHYTQIVWRNTTQVGCGLASGGGNDTLVCRYSPPGNFTGQAPF